MKGANVTFNFRQDKGENIAVMEVEVWLGDKVVLVEGD